MKRLAFHNFEVFSGLGRVKTNPTECEHEADDNLIGGLLFAASLGDVAALEVMRNSGVDVFACISRADYDKRTALHLAASEGHNNCVEFIIESVPEEKRGFALSVSDRWGNTPLDDAIRNGHGSCETLLKNAGASRGQKGANLFQY